jgi:hypothetical protein
LLCGSGGGPRTAGTFVVEQIVTESGPHLLVLTPPGRSARVNGAPLPRVGLLRDGDQVLLDGVVSLQVAVVRRFFRQAAERQHTTRPCVVCRGRIVEGREIYLCACEAVMHCESPESSEGSADFLLLGSTDERLNCAAMLPGCPVCQRSIEWPAAEAPRPGVTEAPTPGMAEAPHPGMTEAPFLEMTEVPRPGVIETPLSGKRIRSDGRNQQSRGGC